MRASSVARRAVPHPCPAHPCSCCSRPQGRSRRPSPDAGPRPDRARHDGTRVVGARAAQASPAASAAVRTPRTDLPVPPPTVCELFALCALCPVLHRRLLAGDGQFTVINLKTAADRVVYDVTSFTQKWHSISVATNIHLYGFPTFPAARTGDRGEGGEVCNTIPTSTTSTRANTSMQPCSRSLHLFLAHSCVLADFLVIAALCSMGTAQRPCELRFHSRRR